MIGNLLHETTDTALSLLTSIKTPETKDLTQKRIDFLNWMNMHNEYDGIEKIRKNVTIHEDGLHIQTSL